MEPEKLVSASVLSEIIGVVEAEINQRVKAGFFPQPIRCGRRLIRWRLSTVQAWLAKQESQNLEGTENER